MNVREIPATTRLRQRKARESARREILLASAGVFARRGYAAATLADLAQAAGYAAPSLYRYFSSKEEIFRSLFELIRADLLATFEVAVRADDPLADRVTTLLTAQLELAHSHRDALSLLLAGPPENLVGPGGVRDGELLHLRLLAAWLHRHGKPGELRCSPDVAALILSGAIRALHARMVHEPESGLTAASEVGPIVDLVLHGITTPARGSTERRGAKK